MFEEFRERPRHRVPDASEAALLRRNKPTKFSTTRLQLPGVQKLNRAGSAESHKRPRYGQPPLENRSILGLNLGKRDPHPFVG